MRKSTPARSEPSRRSFLRRGLFGAGLFSLGSALGLFPRSAAGQTRKAAMGRTLGKEFSYDLGELARTDPKLVQFAEAEAMPANLKELRAVAVGLGDQILAGGDRKLIFLDKLGASIRTIALNEPPRCLAASRDGQWYVGTKNQIEVYDTAGQPKAQWDRLGPKTVLTSIGVGERDVFVADAGNRLVLHYDRAGKLLGQIGKRDPARKVAGFMVPSPYFDLALGAGDLVWVANPGEHRVEAYTFAGELEGAWGKAANTIAGFCGCCNPAHLALLPDGRFITSEKGLPRIKVYSPKGEFEGVVAGPESFPKLLAGSHRDSLGLDVAADSQGRVLVADVSQGQIRVFQRVKRAAA